MILARLSPTLRVGTAAFALCGAGAAQAQSVADGAAATDAALPPVVVSATGYAQPLAAALPGVSVFTREQIAQSGATNLDTLLQRAAGVQLARNGGPGQSSNVFVRGFGGPDVLVLLDGVPMNAQDSTGVAYLGNLTTEQIERVEVVRGNVSALYGSGAIGGVILITTRAGAGAPRASISAGAGSHGTYSGVLDASTRVGITALHVGVDRETTQGVSAIDPAQYPAANPNANGWHNTTVNASVTQQWDPHQSFGLRAWRSEGRASYDSASYATPSDTNLASTTQELYQLFSDNRVTTTWESHVSVSQQTTTSTVANFSAYPFTSSYRTRVQQVLWRNVFELNTAWKASAGVDLQRQDIASATGGIAPRQRDVRAVFAGAEGAVGAHRVQLNVRHDDVDGYSGQDTGYLGYGYVLGGGFQALASVSTAFNAAPLGYLYAPYYGNPGLQPEKARSVETGLQWSQGADLVRATLFQTRATDQWLYDYTSSTFQNIASSRTRGLDLVGRGSWRGWGLDANLTLQQPVNLVLPGEPTLQRQARVLANLTAQRRLWGVNWSGTVHYTGPRWDQAAGQRVNLGGYATVDLSASGAITPQWSWNARVQNLFDKAYQTVWGYEREPFGVFVGLTWHTQGL